MPRRADLIAQKFAPDAQQTAKWNVFSRWSVFLAGYSPTPSRDGLMKGIMLAVGTIVLGTLAYITIGIALASVG
jgi:hypothetical protein